MAAEISERSFPMSLLEVSSLSKTPPPASAARRSRRSKSVTFSVESGGVRRRHGRAAAAKPASEPPLGARPPHRGIRHLGGQNLCRDPRGAAAFRRDHLRLRLQDFQPSRHLLSGGQHSPPPRPAGQEPLRDEVPPCPARRPARHFRPAQKIPLRGLRRPEAARRGSRAHHAPAGFSLPTSRPVRSTPGSTEELLRLFDGQRRGADHRHGHALRPRGQLCSGASLPAATARRTGAHARHGHGTAFYRRIADALTASQTGAARYECVLLPRLALSGMRRDRRIYAPTCRLRLYDGGGLRPRLPRRQPALYAVGSGVNGMGTSAIRLVMTPRQVGDGGVCPPLLFFCTNAFLIRRRRRSSPHERPRHGPRRARLASFSGDRFSALRLPHRGTRPRRALTQLSARVSRIFARTELPALPLLDLGASSLLRPDRCVYLLSSPPERMAVPRPRGQPSLAATASASVLPRSQWLSSSWPGPFGGAYYLAVTITEPITAMSRFLIAAVGMVILATSFLFIAGSVYPSAARLQGNDRFYYSEEKLCRVSLARLSYEAPGVGLAVICILSTMTFVMLGSTAAPRQARRTSSAHSR